jgi:hypothetical protein
MAGSNPPASETLAGDISGTYLDTANTAACNGNITSWHYCYYPPAARQTLTMTVAAWRLEGGTYRLIKGTSRNITLSFIATLAIIFCMEETVDPVDYVLITEGDVIGVVLPNTNPLPVVGSNTSSASSMKKHLHNAATADLLVSEFTEIPDTALHVYANLGKSIRLLLFPLK